MALTKAEMAERLFEDLGLNKREAKELVEAFFEEIRMSLEAGNRSNCPGLATSIFAIKTSGLGGIPKPVRRFRSLLVAL